MLCVFVDARILKDNKTKKGGRKGKDQSKRHWRKQRQTRLVLNDCRELSILRILFIQQHLTQELDVV